MLPPSEPSNTQKGEDNTSKKPHPASVENKPAEKKLAEEEPAEEEPAEEEPAKEEPAKEEPVESCSLKSNLDRKRRHDSQDKEGEAKRPATQLATQNADIKLITPESSNCSSASAHDPSQAA